MHRQSSRGRVVVAMSGGVDSSLTAVLLKNQGYDVIGITMQVWPKYVAPPGGDASCCSLDAVEDARRVAECLDIPHYVMNFEADFQREIIDPFCRSYLEGLTPNPCVECNRRIKFDLLLKKAIGLGASYMATGHYARVVFDDLTKRYVILKAADKGKDQTYVLYNMTQDQLSHTLMPLGEYTKTQIRQMAADLDLVVADKPDSQEICFITTGDYRDFLEEHVARAVKPGSIVDVDGNVLGQHRGIAFFTIGQRKGLGLSSDRPLYVVDLDPCNNTVIVGDAEDVYGQRFTVRDANFLPFDRLEDEMTVQVKIRYNVPYAVPGRIRPLSNGDVLVELDEPQRAITPGQSGVFYDGDMLVGGGIIVRERPRSVFSQI